MRDEWRASSCYQVKLLGDQCKKIFFAKAVVRQRLQFLFRSFKSKSTVPCNVMVMLWPNQKPLCSKPHNTSSNSDRDTCVYLITYRARNTSEPRIKLPSIPAGTYSGKSRSWFSSTSSRTDLAEAICSQKTDMLSIIPDGTFHFCLINKQNIALPSLERKDNEVKKYVLKFGRSPVFCSHNKVHLIWIMNLTGKGKTVFPLLHIWVFCYNKPCCSNWVNLQIETIKYSVWQYNGITRTLLSSFRSKISLFTSCINLLIYDETLWLI